MSGYIFIIPYINMSCHDAMMQIGVAILVFLIFSWLRLTSGLRRFYAPKRFDKTVEGKPRRLPPGFFAWWWQVPIPP